MCKSQMEVLEVTRNLQNVQQGPTYLKRILTLSSRVCYSNIRDADMFFSPSITQCLTARGAGTSPMPRSLLNQ